MSAEILYTSGVLYGVGLCFGITLCTLIFFYHCSGGSKKLTLDRNNMSFKMVYLMGLIDIMYYQVKVPQLNGVNNDCGTQEALSVLFYLGSNLVLYVFYLIRYTEVYGWRPWVIVPGILLITIFFIAIPVSIASNQTLLVGGGCAVYHPPISALLPSITCFVISVYNMVLFLQPLIRGFGAVKKKKLAITIFVTNLVAMVSTVFFNASLNYRVTGQYAPLTSSMDLAVNFVMVTLPYIMAKLPKLGDAAATNNISNEKTPSVAGKQNVVQQAKILAAKSMSAEESAHGQLTSNV